LIPIVIKQILYMKNNMLKNRFENKYNVRILIFTNIFQT